MKNRNALFRPPDIPQRGYAIYLVIVILGIIAIFISVAIRAFGMADRAVIGQVHKTQARLLAESGIERAEFFFNGGDGHDIFWETDSFSEALPDYGSIFLNCKQFGVFKRISSTGTRLKTQVTIRGLAGRDAPEELKPALTLTNHMGGLILENGSAVTGAVIIDGGEIRRGKNRTVVSSVSLMRKRSPALPVDMKPVLKFMQRCDTLLGAIAGNARAIVGPVTISDGNDSLLRRKPLLINGDCTVIRCTVGDAFIVVLGRFALGEDARCDNSAIIGKTAQIDNGNSAKSVFYCDSTLRIDRGRHASQFFAGDSMIIGPDASFGDPSVWICRRKPGKDTVMHGVIRFPDGCRIRGIAISFTDTTTKPPNPVREGASLCFGKGGRIDGIVMTDGDIDVQEAVVKGSIWARSIRTSVNRIDYINWLFGCTLEADDAQRMFPLVAGKDLKIRIME